VERDTEVTGIRVTEGRVAAVDTTRGTIATRVVVNAAGPHARQVGAMAGVEVPVQPFRRHIFIAQPGGEPRTTNHEPRTTNDEPRTTNHERPPWLVPDTHVMVIDFESTFYFHREGAGVLFGMGDPNEAPTFDLTVQWDFLPQVIDVAVKRLPALTEASVSHAWAGLYEMTPDANPIVGEAASVAGLFLINGFSGHGFQHSPAAGRILADVIAGRDPQFDLTPFALERFARAGAGGERYVV
jgi:sarcosine oxidase subunit beta